MNRLLLSLVLLIIPLFVDESSRIDCFINGLKNAYSQKIRQLSLGDTFLYVPSIMNLVEDGDWMKLSILERRNNIWACLSPPILANDFAIDTLSQKCYIFPEGWLYNDKDSLKTNRMIELNNSYCSPRINALKEYLHDNVVDFLFTVPNLGEYGRYFWAIKNDQLYILIYDKHIGSIYPFNAEDYLKDNDSIFVVFDGLSP